MTDKEKQAIEKLHNGKKMDLISIIRTFKREGIEKFVVTKKETIETVLNLIEMQQAEIKKYKEMYAVSVADRVNSAFKQEHKNNEDLEMLYNGCQIELEEKDKIIDRMADFMWDYDCCSNFPQEYCKDCCDLGQGKQCIKDYFKKKVEDK